jgi:hypothetical protein
MARIAWADLGAPALAFRCAHAAWGVAGMASLGAVWLGALRRRRGPGVVSSVAFLCVEGVALVVGRGDCPMGGLQRRLGDPVPLFELVLPARAAKAAVPVLAMLSLAGFAALALRRPVPRT